MLLFITFVQTNTKSDHIHPELVLEISLCGIMSTVRHTQPGLVQYSYLT